MVSYALQARWWSICNHGLQKGMGNRCTQGLDPICSDRQSYSTFTRFGAKVSSPPYLPDLNLLISYRCPTFFRLRRLFSLTKTAVQTKHVVQQLLDSWSDEKGHVVLVGDAAHVLNASFPIVSIISPRFSNICKISTAKQLSQRCPGDGRRCCSWHNFLPSLNT